VQRGADAGARRGRAPSLHCLPADITGVSCKEGEVAASVFDRYRDLLYREAGYEPHVIAAMIFLAKVKHPADVLMRLLEAGGPRVP
jgi:ornithine carbamoyltransferase